MKIILRQFAEGFKASDVFDKGVMTNIPKNKADANQIQNGFNLAYFWAGIICVAIIIVSGIYYAISAGDSSRIKKAKDTLTYAIIGLAIVILAFAITNFVLGAI